MYNIYIYNKGCIIYRSYIHNKAYKHIMGYKSSAYIEWTITVGISILSVPLLSRGIRVQVRIRSDIIFITWIMIWIYSGLVNQYLGAKLFNAPVCPSLSQSQTHSLDDRYSLTIAFSFCILFSSPFKCSSNMFNLLDFELFHLVFSIIRILKFQ